MDFSYSDGEDVAWVEVPLNENIELRQGLPKGRWSGGKFVHEIEREMQFYDVSNIRMAFVIIKKESEKALIKECLD